MESFYVRHKSHLFDSCIYDETFCSIPHFNLFVPKHCSISLCCGCIYYEGIHVVLVAQPEYISCESDVQFTPSFHRPRFQWHWRIFVTATPTLALEHVVLSCNLSGSSLQQKEFLNFKTRRPAKKKSTSMIWDDNELCLNHGIYIMKCRIWYSCMFSVCQTIPFTPAPFCQHWATGPKSICQNLASY